MAVNLKICANDLKRYKEIALLLRIFGRSDLVLQLGSDEAIDSGPIFYLSSASRGFIS